MPAVKTICGPVWGILADKIGNKKGIFLFNKILSSLALLTYAIPGFATTFLRILLVSICINIFVAPGVLNAYTLQVCGPFGKKLYGQIRLYKALSWGIGCGVMGLVTDRFGFNYNFIIYGVLSVMSTCKYLIDYCIIILLFIPFCLCPIVTIWYLVPAIESKHESNVEEKSFYRDVVIPIFCKRPDVVIFLIEIFIMGAAVALVERLLFVYIKNDLEGSTTLCGLSVMVNVLFELPVFHFASKILDTLGHNGCFIVAYFCYFVRVWAYTFLTKDNVWLLLPIESLHGFTFAILWIAAVEFTRSWAPKGWESASQSIMSTTYQCVAVFFGSIIGGHAMEMYGAKDVYRFAGCVIFVMFSIRVLYYIYTKCKTLFADDTFELIIHSHFETYIIHCKHDDTVQTAKQLFCKQIGLLLIEIRFTYAGEQLENNKTLTSYGIPSNPNVFFVRRMILN